MNIIPGCLMLLFICIFDVILKSIHLLNNYQMLKYIVICTVLHCVNAPYQYTRDEKILCVAEYLRNNVCMISTERALQRKYGFHPATNTISRLVNNFLTYGNVEKPREERTMTARTQHIIGLVEEMVIEATENGEVISVRRVARELGITNSTVYLILKKDLNFHPYHPITIHHLNEDDPEVRIEFSRLFLICKIKIRSLWTK